jgi:sugar/nucleoside kinase (ribokinase family)
VNRIIDSMPGVINRLNEGKDAGLSAFIGFDACIDSIVKIVKDKGGDGRKKYFDTSTQFGEFLIKQNDKSCGIELDTKLSKIGGNMVITGNALGNLGIRADCVGTFGLPDILPFFHEMSDNCTLYSVAEHITATALEFSNSKVIVFDPGPYNKLSWTDIENAIGPERIKEMVRGKNLVSFLNWSEIEKSTEIWEGFIDEILPDLSLAKPQSDFFTDLSDCSRKSSEEIKALPGLFEKFRKYFRVTLSLNQNEAELVAKAFDIPLHLSDADLIKSLYEKFNADILVLHRIRDAIAYNGISFERCDTFYCGDPVVLTGGGDNFNAGFCLGLLHHMDLFQCLLVANAVAGAYVASGESPSLMTLSSFLQKTVQ